MTITDIGILLVILCVLLWAIMAALHRHTVQLEALRKAVESLRSARGRDPAPREYDAGDIAADTHPKSGNEPPGKR